MKSNNDFRSQVANIQDAGKKAVKLEPIRKSGKEKHTLYKGLSHPQDEDDEDFDLSSIRKRESILDYMDDSDEDELEDEYEAEYEDQPYEDDQELEEED